MRRTDQRMGVILNVQGGPLIVSIVGAVYLIDDAPAYNGHVTFLHTSYVASADCMSVRINHELLIERTTTVWVFVVDSNHCLIRDVSYTFISTSGSQQLVEIKV